MSARPDCCQRLLTTFGVMSPTRCACGRRWQVIDRAWVEIETPGTRRVGPLELRYDEPAAGGQLDEIVGSCLVHLERMDDDHVWLGLSWGRDQQAVHVNLSVQDGRLVMVAEET